VENKDINIGDLVRLKRNLTARLSHPLETPESMGLGIILNKLTELLIFPHNDKKIFEFDSDINPLIYKDKNLSNEVKTSVKTKICKVYWFKISKTKWEYDDDLQIAKVEAPYC